MNLSWTDIAFAPDSDLAAATAEAWRWLVPGPWKPVVCSMIGGIFFELEGSGVHWLECGTGLIERVADNVASFEASVRADRDMVEEWFMPPLVAALHAAGKRPSAGQCYAFMIPPVFAEGKFEVSNIFVAPRREVFVGMADIHRQIAGLSDGQKVQIKIVD